MYCIMSLKSITSFVMSMSLKFLRHSTEFDATLWKMLTYYLISFRYFLYHLRYFRFSSGPHSIHDKDEPLKLKLPSWVKKVDAATTIDGILYVFSSRFVWKVQSQGGQQKDEESAKEIATLFPGLPNNLSAALSQKRNGKIISYFLKNDMMYLYDVR